ncbi:alpha/beta fold hydrolase [Sinosporangium siamense]|uniref:Hydrolase or acyltransferase of alpha/beta superfamily protein n=1 Tax=Sinosporangium siamense TaxID=1367973 RepID=A0A919RKX8_9ACTN|nr:alpha/beta hydrolase [Sinosporangium siamense]GII95097.1 hydrolase or acyltransferase of alpha/beta superfamily protein [Sinosporangium siamense]
MKDLFGKPAFARTRDGRRLHYVTQGEGEPRVVFESGLGATRTEWGMVMPAVAEHAAVLAYDRAGLGRSEPDHMPRDHARMAEDLLDLLDGTGVRRCVLVGHSLGGALVTLFALRYPARVAGLVLVDPSVPPEDVKLPDRPLYRAARLLQPLSDVVEAVQLRAGEVLARFGAAPVASELRKMAEPFPPDMRAEILDELARPATFRATRAETAGQGPSLSALHRLLKTERLPHVPVTVISGALRPASFADLWRALEDCHRRLAGAQPYGRHVVAGRSGHMVPQDEPGLVAEEILRVVREAGA